MRESAHPGAAGRIRRWARPLLVFVPLAIAASAPSTSAGIGACCLPRLQCIETTADSCHALGGLSFSEDTRCRSGQCLDSYQIAGSCCRADGTCVLVRSEERCGDGLFIADSLATCDPNPCRSDLGSCCLCEGDCLILTAEECAQRWDAEFRLGERCTNWCDGFLFERGRCCLADGSCVYSDPDDCGGRGGHFVACTPCGYCAPFGACCLPDRRCIDTAEWRCAQIEGAVFRGLGIPCPDRCSDLDPLSRTSWGRIKSHYR